MGITESRKLIRDFLKRCVEYADESIKRKKERGEDEGEISKWIAYRDFTEHAVMEVESGELDSWLEEGS
ncbi:MAG: hypothetical protein CMA79_00045 [Euryarchaeota archaeon]|nr:hypothetical protein [Euryarchaeota archaeon]MBN54824.1 hypothetical protein [Euryarchaeota archaeon]MEC9457832.1 hypothetical protein [Candidatus Thermoplasmatota archaeon]MED5398314.1 hypothetical protein [Candidatus Thermoplasmatota archaeon]|tara:strand:+ start:456 stop:662 length:207 start_codon:yes stop_codon:yes gene_type:complete